MSTWKGYCDYMLSRGGIENVMIVDASSGALWATSNPSFYLREYKAMLSDKEQVVNEADIIVKLIGGKEDSTSQGLRINGVKHQIIRTMKDDVTGFTTLYGKIERGGSCVSHAGRCILLATFSEAMGHQAVDCNNVLKLMGVYLSKSLWPDAAAKLTINNTAAPAPVNNNNNNSSNNTTSSTAAGGVASNSNSNNSSSSKPPQSSGNSSIWQSMVTEKLINKGNILKALILSKDDCSVLAASSGFQLQTYQTEIPQEDGTDKLETVEEAKNIALLMSGSKPSQGLRVEQTKFQILRSFDDEAIKCYTSYGKKKLGGICIIATVKVIIVALFDETEGHTAAGCNEDVASLAKLLRDKNS